MRAAARAGGSRRVGARRVLRRLRLAVVTGVGVSLVACGSPPGGGSREDGSPESGRPGAGPSLESPAAGGASPGIAALVQPHALPEGAPPRFSFGAEAPPARVAAWDIDVKPDGEGLPPGRGSVAEGEAVYQSSCVACHGPTGVEGPNDRLVGTTPWREWPEERAIGNYWPYATTLFDYIRRAMPQTEPGTLSADETYAVIAYLLHRNELIPADAVMDAATLPAVEMPARDRFVVDDREGGAEVR